MDRGPCPNTKLFNLSIGIAIEILIKKTFAKVFVLKGCDDLL